MIDDQTYAKKTYDSPCRYLLVLSAIFEQNGQNQDWFDQLSLEYCCRPLDQSEKSGWLHDHFIETEKGRLKE